MGVVFYSYNMNNLEPDQESKSSKERLYYSFWCIYKVVTVQGLYLHSRVAHDRNSIHELLNVFQQVQ